MKLERLLITLEDYGPNKGRYSGAIRFRQESGSVELFLTPEISQKLLSVVADDVVDSAKNIANNMAANVLDGQLKLTEEQT